MPQRTKKRRLALALVCAWLTWTALIGAVHWLGWVEPDTGPRPPASIVNAVHMASAPGWVVMRLATGRSLSHTAIGGVGAGAISGVCWIIALLVANRVRIGLTHRKPRTVAALPDPARRAFLVNGAFIGAALGAGASGAKATLLDPWDLTLRRYTVPIRGLPASLDGLRIAFFTDPHLGFRVPEAFIERAVAMTDALDADLVVLGGDYIDFRPERIGRAARLLAPLAAPRPGRIGAVGVLGNHDWYGDGPATSAALETVGVRMLDNRRCFLDAATRTIMTAQPAGDSLCIAGLGDLGQDVVDVRAALGGVRPETPRLVIAHEPDTAEIGPLRDLDAPRIDLMLSGHTHGGQVRLPLVGAPIVPSRYGQKYAGGLVEGPRFPVLVSRGIGMSILPIRFAVAPEIVEVTLTRA
jgi:predicted MPP superfamily phosphohydrolase